MGTISNIRRISADIRKSFYTALKKCDILYFHFHDLRHTFARQLMMSVVDIITVRELLGHQRNNPLKKIYLPSWIGNNMDTF